MKNEYMRVQLTDGRWLVFYRGLITLPKDWNEIEGAGYGDIEVSEQIHSTMTLADAHKFAKNWADGSGFKVGPIKIDFGDVLRMNLRRP